MRKSDMMWDLREEIDEEAPVITYKIEPEPSKVDVVDTQYITPHKNTAGGRVASCRTCRYLVYIDLQENLGPAPPGIRYNKVYYDNEGEICMVMRRGQGLRYEPVTSSWYCDLKVGKILESLGIDPDIPRDELYKYVDHIDLEGALAARSMIRRLNDPYVRHRGDVVYWGELNVRMEHYNTGRRAWAQSRSRLLQEELEDEYCDKYAPRRW